MSARLVPCALMGTPGDRGEGPEQPGGWQSEWQKEGGEITYLVLAEQTKSKNWRDQKKRRTESHARK